jgi:hypothetical protein
MSTKKRSVHVAIIAKQYKGKTYVTHLLRHAYREDGKVKHLTLGNLSDLPDDLIDAMRKQLAGGPLPAEQDDFQIVRSLPHGSIRRLVEQKTIQLSLCDERDEKNTKMQKHFELEIKDDSFSYRRREEQISEQAALDGLYVCVPV